jgi:cytochrome c peroxidase
VKAAFFGTLVSVLALCGCGEASRSNAPAPSDEAKLTRLELVGKRLFFDATLSNPAGQSCGSCHDPATGFSGNFGSPSGVPLAADGVTLGLRNTPTASYASFTPAFSMSVVALRSVASGGQFLDGRAATLEEQAAIPFFSAGEMNLASPAQLTARLANAAYAPLMLEEFGTDLFTEPARVLRSVTQAIAAFERTADFAPFSSKLDQWLAGSAQFSDLEKQGMAVFSDPLKGNCVACHAFEPQSQIAAKLLFTDFSYRNLGVPRNMRIPANADPAFFDLGLCGPRRERVADDSLCGTFKVPTLRNVSRRKSLMHNGVFSNVRDAVAFHATRGASSYDDVPAAFQGNVDRTMIRLDEGEINAVVAFLLTLEDGFGPSRLPGAR